MGDEGTRSAVFGSSEQRWQWWPADVEGYVADAGLELIHRYGGRIFMDFIADNESKQDPTTYAQIEALEFELCGRSPYRDIGRFWQVVAQRPG